MVIKIREEDKVRSRGLFIAVGLKDTGHREILGFRLDDSESEQSWTEFFRELKQTWINRSRFSCF